MFIPHTFHGSQRLDEKKKSERRLRQSHRQQKIEASANLRKQGSSFSCLQKQTEKRRGDRDISLAAGRLSCEPERILCIFWKR